ncbi:endonuclease/exonuclease/phosphatase family protein [Rubellicoccus peritrichatus]|uniref:Endonuclease/exonuclease/phosphatase family protein n=1 Tax=Rubellicoccus peritrichatus TaxID=3080537 RepID=A0AAQ3LBE6_9BACT|nr:endonuclease/exonuclease/phosphatase family protein [Puniceicoccus sp. CR14]WOO42636.1 endonuclease/exonuclease/phosphatase family protein [Puniceicoccus sp. CR14]
MTTRLKLLTFNIAHGRGLSLYQGLQKEKRIRNNLTRIARVIRESGADLVALQEVDQDSHWNKQLDLLEIIREESGFEHLLYGINTRRSGKRHLAYGNGILSRHPVHIWENNPFGTASLGEKGFLYAEIDIAGHHLPLINLHLDYKSRKKRIEQVEQIISFITDKPHPGNNGNTLAPIICGDFNSRSAPLGDAVSHLFRFVQRHGDYKIYPRQARTFPAHFPSKGIDFIMLPYPYQMTESKVIKTKTSDHLPVLVEFELAD